MENKPLAFLIHIHPLIHMSLCTQLQTLLNMVSISVHKYKKIRVCFSVGKSWDGHVTPI